MRRNPIPWLTFLAAAFTFGCDETVELGEEQPTEEPGVEAPAGEEPMADGPALQVTESPELGPYLTDAEGRALYLFEADPRGESTCYDACAEAWPPYTADREPRAAAAPVKADLIGQLERKDGEMQVTYNGHPLYYFAQDTGPGDVKGQDVEGHGGEWYLVTPEGEQVGHAEEGGGGQ